MSDHLPNPSDTPPTPEGAEQRDELERGVAHQTSKGMGASAVKWSVTAALVGAVIGVLAGWLISRSYQIANSAMVTMVVIGLVGAFTGSVYGFVNGGISRGKEERRKEEGV